MSEILSSDALSWDVLDMLQNSVALIGVYDSDERLCYTNAAFREAYFIDPDERLDWQTLMRRNFDAGRGTVIKTDDIEGWISSVRSRRGKSPQRTYESDLHDGRFIWVTETMRPDGWIIYVGTDVTPLNASERHLRLARDELFRQSSTDELTGVSNRRHILGKLEDVQDDGQTSWVCIMDIDHFKQVNDLYGHDVGDDVLVRVAQTVRETIKLKDAFGRVGGEEFMVILPNQSFEDARATLMQLQEAIRGLCCRSDLPELRVTVAGGMTQILPQSTQKQVLQRADRGLYFAKTHGRDQICVCAGDDAAPDQFVRL